MDKLLGISCEAEREAMLGVR